MNWNNSNNKELIEALLVLRNKTEARNFLRDLLTEQEINEFGKRLQTAKMLSNKIPYIQIEDKTGLSSTTIARVSQWLNNGMGGYKLILARLHHTNPSGK